MGRNGVVKRVWVGSHGAILGKGMKGERKGVSGRSHGRESLFGCVVPFSPEDHEKTRRPTEDPPETDPRPDGDPG
jgi:hypothetical protein